MYVSSVSIF